MMKGFLIRAFLSMGTLACGVSVAATDTLGDGLPAGAVQRLGTLRMRYPGGISDLCFLPDGRGVIATGHSVEIWNLEEGNCETVHDLQMPSLASMTCAPAGSALLVADSAGKVAEITVKDGRVLRSISTDLKGISRAVYSPDGERVLVTVPRPPSLSEWSLGTGNRLVTIEGAMHSFRSAIYGREPTTAYVDGSNGSGPVLAHYRLTDGALLKAWHKDYYSHSRSLVLSSDRERVLLGSRHMATEWTTEGYKLLGKFTGHHGHAVTSVAYGMKAEQILTGSRDGSIRLWDRVKKKVLLRWVAHNGHVTRIAVSPDGRWALSYGGRTVAQHSLETGAPRVTWERHTSSVEGVAFLGEGNRVVSASSDGSARIWDAVSGKSLRMIGGARLGAYCVAVRADGDRFVVGCKDGIVREFEAGKGECVRQLKGHRGFVRAVGYLGGGGRLFSSAGDGTVRIWPEGQGGEATVLSGHRGGVLTVAVSSGGRVLLSGGRDGTVRVWETETRECLHVLHGPFGWVQGVAFANASTGVSVGRDEFVTVWDLAEGRLVKRIDVGGHCESVVCSADGRFAYAGRKDGRIVVCDLASGEMLRQVTGHKGAVRGLSLSPAGALLVSASEDCTLLVWSLTDGLPASSGE